VGVVRREEIPVNVPVTIIKKVKTYMKEIKNILQETYIAEIVILAGQSRFSETSTPREQFLNFQILLRK
jgi:hypothetical protein